VLLEKPLFTGFNGLRLCIFDGNLKDKNNNEHMRSHANKCWEEGIPTYGILVISNDVYRNKVMSFPTASSSV